MRNLPLATTFVKSNAIESKEAHMKKGLLTLLVVVVVLVVLSSCRRRKEACAAYNRVEVTEQK